MRKVIPLIAACVTLTGCLSSEEIASRRAAEEAARAAPYERWVGRSEQELVAVWGEADRVTVSGDVRTLVYATPETSAEVRVGFSTNAPPRTGVGITVTLCRTTFQVVGGLITGWDANSYECAPPPPPPR